MPITDGVFPEAKEFLMGYWIADVESPEQLRIGSPLRIRNGSGRSLDARIDGHRYCAWTLFEHICWNSLEIARAPLITTVRRQENRESPRA